MAAHKYKAIPTNVDGLRFDSKGEARRFQELQLLEKSGEIKDLRLQPAFDLHAHGSPEIKVGTYKADFEYIETATGARIIEDFKGVKTPMYRWKKKHLLHEYGIEIREVTK